MNVFDLAVVGGGPGGYATALRAANHGMRVAIVEQAAVGGTCLHRGCVPSKALLHVGRLADEVPQLVELGLAAPGPGIDVEAAKRFSDGVVDQLHTGLKGLLKMRTVEVIYGRGSVAEPGRVVVSGDGGSQEIRVGQIVIATGSVVAELGNMPFDHDRILSSDDALRLARVPRSAVIIGAGAVGVEFASLWCSLGSNVTVLELADRVLPLEDPDSSAALARALERRGAVLTRAEVYRRECPVPAAEELRALEARFERREIQVITATSAEIGGNLWALATPALRRHFDTAHWLVPSARVADILRQGGFKGPIVQAASAEDEGLVSAVLRWRSTVSGA